VTAVYPGTADFSTLAPAGIRILAALDNAARVLGIDLTITCACEGHPPGDPHTTGEAMDVRVRGFSTVVTLKLVMFLQQVLGPLFTVLLETPKPFTDPDLAAIQTVNPHASGPHLHLQRKKGTTWPPPAGVSAA